MQLQAQCPKKPDYPTKLLYISDEVTGGSGNQFSFLTEALRLAKCVNSLCHGHCRYCLLWLLPICLGSDSSF